MSSHRRSVRSGWLARAGMLGLIAGLIGGSVPTVSAEDSLIKQAAQGNLRQTHIRTPAGVKRMLPQISGGARAAAQAVLAPPDGDEDLRAEAADAASNADPGLVNITPDSLGCRERNGAMNVRVNQDCTFRRQAEELIKVNPIDPNNLIAGQNDSRIGYNHCGFDYSLDAGQHWGDGIPPFYQRQNNPPAGHTLQGGAGTRHTYDAASDPALTFDSQGDAYYSCVVFDVNSNASAILVTRSPKEARGSFYNNVPATGSRYVVVEDNSANFFHDKEFIVADSYVNSPFRDNVYVTWTLFEFNERCRNGTSMYCSSRIFFSRSSDRAETWSAPIEISGRSTELCFLGNLVDPSEPANACDFDQGSDPIVLPDGRIVVTFNNGNTALTDPNSQQLAVYSQDGGATWSAPVKVGTDVTVNEPQCNFGRGPEECIPGAFIRTNDFPRIAFDRVEFLKGVLYVAWQDYRHSTFNIQLSRSIDGGRTWQEAAAPVNPTVDADHYMPAIDVTSDNRVAVSYYRTDRVPNENVVPLDGFMPGRDPGVQDRSSDYQLAGGFELATPYNARQVSPQFLPPDGAQAGFNGDYSGLVVVGTTAHPIWSDTRNVALGNQGVVHDEDVFTDTVEVPAARPSKATR